MAQTIKIWLNIPLMLSILPKQSFSLGSLSSNFLWAILVLVKQNGFPLVAFPYNVSPSEWYM